MRSVQYISYKYKISFSLLFPLFFHLEGGVDERRKNSKHILLSSWSSSSARKPQEKKLNRLDKKREKKHSFLPQQVQVKLIISFSLEILRFSLSIQNFSILSSPPTISLIFPSSPYFFHFTRCCFTKPIFENPSISPSRITSSLEKIRESG